MTRWKETLPETDVTGACVTRQRENGEHIIWMRVDSHLTLEFLHNIQENVIDIGAVMELDLDSIEVTERVCDIELPVSTPIHSLQRGLRCCFHVILFLSSGRSWHGYHGCGCRSARTIGGRIWGGNGGNGGLRLCLHGWLRCGGMLEGGVCSGLHERSRPKDCFCED